DCLFVEDARPETSDPWPRWPHSRTAIDRLSRTARDRTLFVSEVVAGGKRSLKGSLRGRHPAGVLSQYDGGFPLEYSLLLAGLRSLESLGGDRSSGLGSCRIEVPEGGLHWQGGELELTRALDSFAEDWKVMLDLARETTAT